MGTWGSREQGSGRQKCPETINVRMSERVENFYKSLIESDQQHCQEARSQILGRMSFAASFPYLDLRSGRRRITGRWERTRCRTVKIVCSLESGYAFRSSQKRTTSVISKVC